MKKKKQTLSTNQTIPAPQGNGVTASGGSQPPRKRMVPRAHIRRTETYSPRKKRRKGVEEYSTWKPATSSDSASTRSKGGRLVSASAEMKKITNNGNSGSQYHWNMPNGPACACTILVRLSEPAHSNTEMNTKPIETS